MALSEQIIKRCQQLALAGDRVSILPVAAELELARRGLATQAEIQRQALNMDILPARYLRNYGTVGLEGQKRLFSSCVAVVGAGGLGGWIVELLARMGLGRLIVIDGDCFSGNNLNRQLLAEEGNLGEAKALAAQRRVAAINGGVLVDTYPLWLTEDNSQQLLKAASVAVDALDNLPSRFLLQEAAGRLKIPLIHGAIGGFQGQVLTIFPGDPGLELVYPGGRERDGKGAEEYLGNPAATPAMVAAWQVHEVVKILLKKGEPLRNRLLYLDALDGVVNVFDM